MVLRRLINKPGRCEPRQWLYSNSVNSGNASTLDALSETLPKKYYVPAPSVTILAPPRLNPRFPAALDTGARVALSWSRLLRSLAQPIAPLANRRPPMQHREPPPAGLAGTDLPP